MVKRMLIEATHPEETRVVVLDGTRLEEFDVETSTKKQIKGNIYLAKVVRVEPSLQAAFVDYGGNRHGFLAFSEIHPDYYQIPVADRERLMAEALRHEEEEERRDSARESRRQAQGGHDHEQGQDHSPDNSHDQDHAHDHAHDHDHDHTHDHDAHHTEDAHGDHADHDHGDAIPLAFIPPAITSPVMSSDDDEAEESHDEAKSETDAPGDQAPAPAESASEAPVPFEASAETVSDAGQSAPASEEQPASGEQTGEQAGGDTQAPHKPDNKAAGVETVGGEEDEEEAAEDKQRRRFVASRHYKIQEVIKRRQIMLIQVVKEERGNKGAALTTFLSLAGRYCVLMPNSPRGGGVSRKITSAQDRRRLKAILGDLELPKNMAVILRTAGAERNKTEIKRDYEYLQRTWNSIREVTMTSRAPALIHEEASLIKRAIRDIYSRDIEEVWVEGEEGYKVGKDFMKMLTPSHAKKVQRYKDDIIPLFHRYQVESQMEAINSPTVQLRSGGSIVFAQTEALVAIDVNSGRATKERHIEETAYKTNMEAADEIARQLRLRDLAGLIVIDFIDMEDSRNNHAVERRLKEALKADRARIQVGRISHFGLLELSRQRLRPSLIEANFRVCAHCAGSGMVRSTESAAVYSLRMLEEEGGRQRSSEVTITVHPDVALYLLNYKREALASIESRYRLRTIVLGDATLVPPNIRLDRVKAVRAAGDENEMAPHREPPREIEHPAVIEADVADDEEDEEEAASSEPRPQESRHRDQRPPRDHNRDHNRDQNRDPNRDANRDANREGGGRDESGGRKRRRRRRRGGANRNPDGSPIAATDGEFTPQTDGENSFQPSQAQSPGDATRETQGDDPGQPGGAPGEQRPGHDDPARRGRRRGRRGGRRRRRGGEPGSERGGMQNGAPNESGAQPESTAQWSQDGIEAAPHDAPRPERAESSRAQSEPAAYVAAVQASAPGASASEPSGDATAPAAPKGFFRALKESWRRSDGDGQSESTPAAAPPSPAPPPAPQPAPQSARAEAPRAEAPRAEPETSGPSRKGWWDAKE